jgi:hypothetical protein
MDPGASRADIGGAFDPANPPLPGYAPFDA